jgi:putative hemolysin
LLPHLIGLGLPESAANTIALIGLIVIISYLSLVFGELVPKRFAMQRSTQIALLLATPLDKFAVVMRPIIWLLSLSTNAIFRLFGGNPHEKNDGISKRELLSSIEINQELQSDEREILSDVIELSNRTLSEVLRPRADVEFLNADLTLKLAAKTVQELPYSRFPVIGDGFDDVLGFVHVRDLLDLSAHKDAKIVRDVMRTILKFPNTNQLLPTLGLMRDRGVHIAIVQDEYGGTDGICTLEDIIEEIIGDIHDEYDLPQNPEIRTGKDGSFSVDGGMSLTDFADETGLQLEDGPYETVAGFILARTGRVAQLGDSVEVVHQLRTDDSDEEIVQTWTLTVSRVEGMRIGRVKVKSTS